MNSLAYTPYDGSAVPFTMGMKPCAERDWIEHDHRLPEQLLLKSQLLDRQQDAVFQALPGTEASQTEVLSMLLAHVSRHAHNLYEVSGDKVIVAPTQQEYSVSEYADAPLLLAGRLVQEDLCLIRPEDGHHVLAAACLCFPSSWKLSDKIGRPMEAVHAPVPGYQANLAQKVNFLMDRLTADRIIWRMNWSLDEGPELHRPVPHSHDAWLSAGADPMEHIYIRVERQTVRRLPETGAILFTIRIYSDPLSRLAGHAEAPSLAGGLIAQLQNMTDREIAYKGLSDAREPIITALKQVQQAG